MAKTRVISSSVRADPRKQPAKSTWAKATYERLPPELREMVYEHLWHLYESDLAYDYECSGHVANVNYKRFIDETIMDQDFAREAFVWYYEHGCLGRKVDASRLGDFLAKDQFGLGVKPASCNMRSLYVAFEGIRYDVAHSRGTKIEGWFDPLLGLDLVQGFKLTLRAYIQPDRGFSVDIAGLTPQLGRLVRKFEAKGCKVVVWFWFRKRIGSLFCQRYVVHGEGGHPLVGMLNATSSEWEAALEKHVKGHLYLKL